MDVIKVLTTMLPAVFISLMTYLVLRWIQLKQYWAKRGVPHIPPHPVLGSLSFLYRENPALWLRRMYERFKAPYVGVWIFWRPGLIVNSEKIAQNILIKDQANFRNRLVSSGTTDPVGSLNLFTLDDPLWSVLRRHQTTLFTSSKLRGIQNTLTLKSKELIERIAKDRQKPEPINLKAIMIDFSTDVTAMSSCGMVSDATLTGESCMKVVTQSYAQYEFHRTLSSICMFFIPEMIDFFRFKMFPTEGTEFLRKVLRTIIAQRGGLENKVTDPRDLVDVLIKMKQDYGKELNMTENMMLAQAATFVQGGFETSSGTLSFGIYELAFVPEVQDKLYRELQDAIDKDSNDLLPDPSVLSQLTYLNCVINETLRKYPVLTWLDRVALKDYEVDENLTIKAGTPVLVNLMGLHYDPDIFPEPEKFNPDRFLSYKSDVKPFAFMPFGEGPRKCIGQRLGYSTVRHGMAAIVLNYEIRPVPNAPKPAEIKINKNTMFLSSKDLLSVEFVPRN